MKKFVLVVIGVLIALTLQKQIVVEALEKPAPTTSAPEETPAPEPVPVVVTQVEAEVAEEVEAKEVPVFNAADEISFRPEFDGLADTVKGWIYIPSLSISQPILQGDDNSKMLEEDEEGKYSYEGRVVLDALAASTFSDEYTILFGHNWTDTDIVFSQLANATRDLAVYIFPENEPGVARKYTLVCAHLGVGRTDGGQLDPSFLSGLKGLDKVAVVQEALEKAYLHGEDTKITEDDEVLVLATCAGATAPRWQRRVLTLKRVFG